MRHSAGSTPGGAGRIIAAMAEAKPTICMLSEILDNRPLSASTAQACNKNEGTIVPTAITM